MGVSYRAQARMPRWLLTAELADLAVQYDPRPVLPDPEDIIEEIDLPWLVA